MQPEVPASDALCWCEDLLTGIFDLKIKENAKFHQSQLINCLVGICTVWAPNLDKCWVVARQGGEWKKIPTVDLDVDWAEKSIYEGSETQG